MVASGGSRSTGKIAALAAELTAIVTTDDPAGQVISASQEDLQELAECSFLPYLAWVSETWRLAWVSFLVFVYLRGTVMET